MGLCYGEWGVVGGWEAWLVRRGRGLRARACPKQEGGVALLRGAWPVSKAMVMPTELCNGEMWVEVAFKTGAWLIRERAWLTGAGVAYAGRGVALY